MHSLEWAFRQDLGSAEKLALVYLCSEASGDGLGSIDRARLTEALGVKARSVQRIVKNLKDEGFLVEQGEFYVVGSGGLVIEAHGILKHAVDHAPSASHHVEASSDGLQINVNTEAIAQELGDYLSYQLNNFEARMGERS